MTRRTVVRAAYDALKTARTNQCVSVLSVAEKAFALDADFTDYSDFVIFRLLPPMEVRPGAVAVKETSPGHHRTPADLFV